jgi:hypothetical protein
MLPIELETRTIVRPVWTSAARTSVATMKGRGGSAKLFCRPAIGTTG